MLPYVLAFIFTTWPPHSTHRAAEMIAIAEDIASTDASAREALELANIAALESTFDRRARGKLGEVGPWQIRPPAASYGADEALRRLRAQGIFGYMGCAGWETNPLCVSMAAHRTEKAILWRLAFNPPQVEAEAASR